MITEAIIASVIAGSSVCSDHFENVSRYNPTDLSDYQKCVHIVHENTAGVVGKNIWVNVNGDFLYIPLSELKGKNKAQVRNIVRLEIVENLITNAVVDEQMERYAGMGLSTEELAVLKQNALANFDINSITVTNPTIPEAKFTFTQLLDEEDNPTYRAFKFNGDVLFTRPLDISEWSTVVEDAAKAAYDVGYAEGYDDGYKKGYEDGFAAGVASVG